MFKAALLGFFKQMTLNSAHAVTAPQIFVSGMTFEITLLQTFSHLELDN